MVEFQKLAPTEFRARVFAVIGVGTQGIVPIGFGVMGILLDMAPTHVVTLTILTIAFLVVLFFVFKYSKEVHKEFEHE